MVPEFLARFLRNCDRVKWIGVGEAPFKKDQKDPRLEVG